MLFRSGDERVDNKVVLRDETATLDDLSSDYGLFVYQTQTAPFPIIRNAELLLLRAEALAQRDDPGDLDAAEDDLNVIRNAAGLGDFDRGTGGQAEVIDEMLRQRRYELFFEGHRWIDVRRLLGDDCTSGTVGTCLNDDLPVDAATEENAWLQFPIPATEQN